MPRMISLLSELDDPEIWHALQKLQRLADLEVRCMLMTNLQASQVHQLADVPWQGMHVIVDKAQLLQRSARVQAFERRGCDRHVIEAQSLQNSQFATGRKLQTGSGAIVSMAAFAQMQAGERRNGLQCQEKGCCRNGRVKCQLGT